MPERNYDGVLCIGDPHLSSRVPGFRKDDYPRAILAKLRWAMSLAQRENLLPVLLGDLFHYPRDNANWLIVELLELFQGTVLSIWGNHDCNENALGDDDTMMVLVSAGRVRLLDEKPWVGKINGIRAAIGGTSWGKALPDSVSSTELDDAELVMWVAHHDVRFPGHEIAARIACREIGGVSLVINGHIHKTLADVICGTTTWCNPGNIARVNRGDATRAHMPGVLKLTIADGAWQRTRIDVPHEAFDLVFHPQITSDVAGIEDGSIFIEGLKSLQQAKTSGGEGLMDFLDRNLAQFEDPRVRQQVIALAREVLAHA
ncbi:MAG TPA: metallophosphoesterase family protein [Humisphaera sp.]|jgi:DNA repair exonuclease SbcCD nuclease subunit|nr:metallophosphoesterase family protein [Humisphaera sp.]